MLSELIALVMLGQIDSPRIALRNSHCSRSQGLNGRGSSSVEMSSSGFAKRPSASSAA